MQSYKIVILDLAEQDLEDAISFYNSRRDSLGEKFFHYFEFEMQTLSINPFYQIRYANIRCKKIKKFPYMIHFTVNKEDAVVYVHAVICNYRNPEDAWLI